MRHGGRLAVAIAGIGVIGPMTPMVPMRFGRAGLFERVGRRAPFAGCRLAREHASGHTGAGEPLELSGQVLAAAALRVHRLPHVDMKLAHRDWLVAVPLPPDRKQVSKHLPAPIAFFGLAHPFGWVLAAEREQRIAHPPAPLCKASERDAGLDVRRNSAPAPDREERGEQFFAPLRDLDADIGASP